MTTQEAQAMSLMDKLNARSLTINYLAMMVGLSESVMDKAQGDDEWSAAADMFVQSKQRLRDAAYGLGWVPYHAAAVARDGR